MKRIAYCSPVNPLPSGISDYSEELLPYLSQYAEVVLFVQRGLVPSNSNLRRHLEVQPVDRLPQLHGARPFDAILYHIGNSPVHAEIYELAQRIPGVVVLHDFVLHHFKLWYMAARRGDANLYFREMAERYGVRGEEVARRMAGGQLVDAAFDMPLVEDVLERAAGLIGHSAHLVNRVRAIRPGLPAERVPMGVPLPPDVSVSTARRALGLPEGIPIWASFGHINPYKRIEVTLRAFPRFRALEPEALYLLVGSVSPSYDLQGLIRRLALDASVHVTGHVAPIAFMQYVAASDLCLNLRYPTAGETSASVLRLLGAGRPTLVSAVDALDELPDDVCGKVDPGPQEGDQILAYGRLLRQAPPIGVRLGRNARRFVAEEHSLERSARGYITFLAGPYGWEALEPQRPVLWKVAAGRDAPAAEDISSGDLPPQPAVIPGVEPREPSGQAAAGFYTAGLAGQLLHDAGSALAEFGVSADDALVLPDVAAVVADLLGPGTPARGQGFGAG